MARVLLETTAREHEEYAPSKDWIGSPPLPSIEIRMATLDTVSMTLPKQGKQIRDFRRIDL